MNEMAIKVIVEFHAKQGRKAELKTLLESVVKTVGPDSGFLGSTLHEVVDNPNILIEIAEWASVEARANAVKQAMESGAYAPLGDLLTAPVSATVISQLH